MSDSGQSNNRLFIIGSVILIGLICLGLAGLAGILAITQLNQAQEEAAVITEPTIPLPTFTPTSTATATPTETPLPTPTGTLVVASRVATGEPAAGGATVDPNATPTGTRVVVLETPSGSATATPTSVPATIPDSGGILLPVDNTYLLGAGAGILFVLLLYGVNHRAKSSARASDD
jgi:hypothetical protein